VCVCSDWLQGTFQAKSSACLGDDDIEDHESKASDGSDTQLLSVAAVLDLTRRWSRKDKKNGGLDDDGSRFRSRALLRRLLVGLCANLGGDFHLTLDCVDDWSNLFPRRQQISHPVIVRICTEGLVDTSDWHEKSKLAANRGSALSRWWKLCGFEESGVDILSFFEQAGASPKTESLYRQLVWSLGFKLQGILMTGLGNVALVHLKVEETDINTAMLEDSGLLDRQLVRATLSGKRALSGVVSLSCCTDKSSVAGHPLQNTFFATATNMCVCAVPAATPCSFGVFLAISAFGAIGGV
jgi:hypothetical protein